MQLRPGLKIQKDPLVYHRTRPKAVRLDREILELELSVLLNQLKFEAADEKERTDLRERIREIGKRTNLARRKRRT